VEQSTIPWDKLNHRHHRGYVGPVSENQRVKALTSPRLIKKASFDQCPICFSDGPLTKEDGPPKGVGGNVLLRTCKRCTNDLGSRVDADLKDWVLKRDRNARVQLSDENRHHPLLLQLTTSTAGAPTIAAGFRGTLDLALMRRPGLGFTITFHFPKRYRLGLLKSAYLAACAARECIPDGPYADEIRADLVKARDREINCDSQSKPATEIRTARLEGPECLRPQIRLFKNPMNVSEQLLVAMASFAISGPPVEELFGPIRQSTDFGRFWTRSD